MSGIMQMLLGAGGVVGSANFFGQLGTSGDRYGVTPSVAVDSYGNVFVGGQPGALAKYNASGALQWQLDVSFGIASLTTDSSGNVYIVGISSSYTVVMKLNSSGTIQWQYQLTVADVYNGYCTIKLDASLNVYVLIGNGISTTKSASIVKINQSGAIQWQRLLSTSYNSGGTYYGIQMKDLAIDTSGNVYAVGSFYNTNSTNTEPYLVKYNSSGTLQWQLASPITYPYTYSLSTALTVGSDGSIYIVFNAASPNCYLIKFNSSGVIQWQLLNASTNYFTKLATDTSGNIYVITGGYLITKFNSSGFVQWVRYLGALGILDGITDDSNNVYCSGHLWYGGTNTQYVFASVPSDGSKTGSYSLAGRTINYSSSTLTVTGSSLSTYTPSVTDSAGSATINTAFQTTSTSSYTSYVTTI